MLSKALSEETFAQIVDALPVRIFWKDRESRFLGCNKLFAADAGVSDPDAFVGKTDFFFFEADQARAFRMDDAQVMASGQAKLAILERLTLTNGDVRWLETSKVPLRNEAGQIIGVLGAYQDVTERIRAASTAN